jgi:hypothetical protein
MLAQNLYIIEINGFSALMDDPHKMGSRSKLRGAPEEVEGLLMETIGLIINDNRYYPEILPTLIAQIESLPCEAERGFIPNAS